METQSSTPEQHKQICVVEDDDQGSISTEVKPSGSQKPLPTTPLFNSKASQNRYENDRQQLLKIFPEKVWHLILSKLAQSDDLEKVSNSSLFFRQMLLDHRVKSLFHNVWPILRNSWRDKKYRPDRIIHYSLQRSRYYSFNPEKNAAIKKEELKLRLVCQSWGKAVDKCHQGGVILMWQNDPSLGEILHKFEATHGLSSNRNPFIGKAVYYVGGDGDNVEFVNATDTILERYGHHFWNFITGLDASISTAYTRLRTFLQNMPNLKTMYIRYCNKGKFTRRCDDPLTGDELQEFETLANANPLPVLQQLQKVTLISFPTELLQQLTRSYGHVSRFIIIPENSFGPDMMDDEDDDDDSSDEEDNSFQVSFPLSLDYALNQLTDI